MQDAPAGVTSPESPSGTPKKKRGLQKSSSSPSLLREEPQPQSPVFFHRSPSRSSSASSEAAEIDLDEFVIYLATRPNCADYLAMVLNPEIEDYNEKTITLQYKFQAILKSQATLKYQKTFLDFFYYAFAKKEIINDEKRVDDFKSKWPRKIKTEHGEFCLVDSLNKALAAVKIYSEQAIFKCVCEWFKVNKTFIFFEFDQGFRSLCRLDGFQKEEELIGVASTAFEEDKEKKGAARKQERIKQDQARKNEALVKAFRAELNGYCQGVLSEKEFTAGKCVQFRERLGDQFNKLESVAQEAEEARTRLAMAAGDVARIADDLGRLTPVRSVVGEQDSDSKRMRISRAVGSTPSPLAKIRSQPLADYAINAQSSDTLRTIISQYYVNKEKAEEQKRFDGVRRELEFDSDSKSEHEIGFMDDSKLTSQAESPPFKIRKPSLPGSPALSGPYTSDLDQLISVNKQCEAVKLLVRGALDKQTKLLCRLARYFTVKERFKPLKTYIAGRANADFFTWDRDTFKQNAGSLQAMFFNMAAAASAQESINIHHEVEFQFEKRYAPLSHLFTCCFPPLRDWSLFQSKRKQIFEQIPISVGSDNSYHLMLQAIDSKSRGDLLKLLQERVGCDFSQSVMGPMPERVSGNPLTQQIMEVMKTGDVNKFEQYVNGLSKDDFHGFFRNEGFEDFLPPLKWLADYDGSYDNHFSSNVWLRFKEVEKIFDTPISYLQYQIDRTPDPVLTKKLGELENCRKKCLSFAFQYDDRNSFKDQVKGELSSALDNFGVISQKRRYFGASTTQCLLSQSVKAFETGSVRIYPLSYSPPANTR